LPPEEKDNVDWPEVGAAAVWQPDDGTGATEVEVSLTNVDAPALVGTPPTETRPMRLKAANAPHTTPLGFAMTECVRRSSRNASP
jgi:hypothetical protein